MALKSSVLHDLKIVPEHTTTFEYDVIQKPLSFTTRLSYMLTVCAYNIVDISTYFVNFNILSPHAVNIYENRIVKPNSIVKNIVTINCQ